MQVDKMLLYLRYCGNSYFINECYLSLEESGALCYLYISDLL